MRTHRAAAVRTAVLAILAAGVGCDSGPAPTGGGQAASDGDPTVTDVPADVKAAYHSVMETRVSPEFIDMNRAADDENFPAVSARARGLIAALRALEAEHARCPVRFVTLHKQLRNQLGAVVEFADGADATQLGQLLGADGRIAETCAACHDRYRPVEH